MELFAHTNFGPVKDGTLGGDEELGISRFATETGLKSTNIQKLFSRCIQLNKPPEKTSPHFVLSLLYM